MRPNTLRDLALSILIGCGFATTLSAQGPVSGSDWWAQCLNTTNCPDGTAACNNPGGICYWCLDPTLQQDCFFRWDTDCNYTIFPAGCGARYENYCVAGGFTCQGSGPGWWAAGNCSQKTCWTSF